MAVPQYQVSLFTNIRRIGTLLRIRPTLLEILPFPRGTVITVPYIGGSRVLRVTVLCSLRLLFLTPLPCTGKGHEPYHHTTAPAGLQIQIFTSPMVPG